MYDGGTVSPMAGPGSIEVARRVIGAEAGSVSALRLR